MSAASCRGNHLEKDTVIIFLITQIIFCDYIDTVLFSYKNQFVNFWCTSHCRHCSLVVCCVSCVRQASPLSVCEPNDRSFCMSVSLNSSSSACSLVYILLRFSTCWIITSTALPIRFSCSQQAQEFRASSHHPTAEIYGSHKHDPTWWMAPNISERLDTLVMDWMRISRFFCSLWMISMDWLSSSHRGIRAWERRKKEKRTKEEVKQLM